MAIIVRIFYSKLYNHKRVVIGRLKSLSIVVRFVSPDGINMKRLSGFFCINNFNVSIYASEKSVAASVDMKNTYTLKVMNVNDWLLLYE